MTASRLHRRPVLATLALLTSLTLSSCIEFSLPREAATPSVSSIPQTQGQRPAGQPLPADSVLEEAGSVIPEPPEEEPIYGSLRPDDATPEERIPEIVERGRLIVGVDQSQNLLSSRDPVTGDLVGFEVDLAREIARDIFDDPNALDFRFVDSAERTQALDNQDVDVIIRTLTITPERQDLVEFSTPYLSADTRMLVSEGSNIENYGDLSGRLVCVAEGSTSVDKARAAAPYSPLLKTQQWSDCLYALQQRQVDAIITDTTILSGMAEQDPYVSIVGEPLGTEVYGVGVRKSTPGDDSSGLVRQVNSTLERIRADGTWWRMYETWFTTSVNSSGPPQLSYREEENPDAAEPQ